MKKRLVLMLLGLGILFFLIFGFGVFRTIMIGKFLATLPNQPQTVATMRAAAQPWQPSLNSVGSIVAINGANLSAEVDGIVDSIDFKSGDNVPAGAVLIKLRANNDDATLAQLQASAAVDLLNYQRDAKQFKADAVSQAQVDSDHAALLAAQAQVTGQQALMAEKIIKAPFAGTLGIREVNLGQYLSAGTQVVTLQQLNPLYMDFYLPQQAISQIAVGGSLQVSVDAYAGKLFPGVISAINAAVDTTTRTFQVRATIGNDALLLRPGMFATVEIAAGSPQSFITLPQTAITYNPYGDTVYVVNPGKDANGKDALKATQQFVTLGDTRGDQVAVVKGLNAGDQVVTFGQLKLKNGSLVTINNSLQPSNDPNPNPPNQ